MKLVGNIVYTEHGGSIEFPTEEEAKKWLEEESDDYSD